MAIVLGQKLRNSAVDRLGCMNKRFQPVPHLFNRVILPPSGRSSFASVLSIM